MKTKPRLVTGGLLLAGGLAAVLVGVLSAPAESRTVDLWVAELAVEEEPAPSPVPWLGAAAAVAGATLIALSLRSSGHLRGALGPRPAGSRPAAAGARRHGGRP